MVSTAIRNVLARQCTRYDRVKIASLREMLVRAFTAGLVDGRIDKEKFAGLISSVRRKFGDDMLLRDVIVEINSVKSWIE
jgi:hypothetical protein